jgi:hypothetical protein
MGIATGYGLGGQGMEPGGETLAEPGQKGPRVQPAPCTMGIDSFPGVRLTERNVGQQPLSWAEVEENVKL